MWTAGRRKRAAQLLGVLLENFALSAVATVNLFDALGDGGADRYQAVLEIVRDVPFVDAIVTTAIGAAVNGR